MRCCTGLLGLTCSILMTGTALAQTQEVFQSFIDSPVTALDPIYLSTPATRQVGRMIYQGLVTYRPAGLAPSDRPGEIVPALAESWDISPDMQSYVFRLRKGARFHSGRLVRAADVQYSFERLANPDLQSPGLSAIANLGLKGLASYQQAVMRREITPHLLGVQVLDTDLVQIHLDRPLPYALHLLAQPYFSIVPQEDVQRWWKDFGKHPIGTGPYQLQGWRPDGTVELQRSKHTQTPLIPQVRFAVLPQPQERFIAFTEKRLDHTPVPIRMFEQVARDPVWNPPGVQAMMDAGLFNDLKRTRLVKMPAWDHLHISLNNQWGPFQHQKVRQALNYAVNKKRLIEQVLHFYARPATGIFPPYFPGVTRTQEPYGYNLEKARKLLFEAGWKDANGDGWIEPYPQQEVALTLWHDRSELSFLLCQAVQTDLKAVGLNTRLSSLAQWAEPGLPPMYQTTLVPEFPDPTQLFYKAFYSGHAGQSNTSFYHNKRVDELLLAAETSMDDGHRLQLYQEAERFILDDAPWIFLVHPIHYYLVQPRVGAYWMHPLHQFPYHAFQFAQRPSP